MACHPSPCRRHGGKTPLPVSQLGKNSALIAPVLLQLMERREDFIAASLPSPSTPFQKQLKVMQDLRMVFGGIMTPSFLQGPVAGQIREQIRLAGRSVLIYRVSYPAGGWTLKLKSL